MTEPDIAPSSPVVTAPPPFVGRREQLDWLAGCLRDAVAGHPQLVLTPGEPGIGKTRLLRELTSIAEKADAHVAFGRCYEDLALPYLPFAEPLFARLLAADTETTPAADAEVIRQVLHAGAKSTAAGDSLQADQDKLRLFLAVSRAAMRLAQRRPMVLIDSPAASKWSY